MMADPKKILQQTPQQLAGLKPQRQDPRLQNRPNDVVVQIPMQQVLAINLRIALMEAPVDFLYKARDQINELINQKKGN